MAAATNIKVGITVTVFLIVLSAVIIWFSQFNPGKSSYGLQGNFKNVGGMVEGSKVYLMGVKVGMVTALVPDRNRVKVMMDIDENLKIPTNTRLAITSKGLVGDKSVEFFVDTDDAPKAFYQPGDIINGNSPAGFDDIIIETKKTLQKTQELIGDPELTRNIKLTTRNIEKFTREMDKIIKQLNGVADNVNLLTTSANGFVGNTSRTVDDINLFVGDLRGFTLGNRDSINGIIANSNRITGSLDKMANNLNEFIESPDSKRDLQLTMKSIRGAADNIQHITGQAAKIANNADLITSDIRDVNGDKGMKENLKDIVANTKIISGTFANTINATTNNAEKDKDKDKKERLNVEFRSEVLGKVNYQFNGATTFDVIGNFNMLAHTGFSKFPFIALGVEELGANNQFNLQAGFYPFDNLRVRLGLIRGKLGVGSNYLIDKTKTEIIAEAYDISSPHVRLGVLQNIYQDYGISAYWDNHFITNKNEFVLGIRWQPSLF